MRIPKLIISLAAALILLGAYACADSPRIVYDGAALDDAGRLLGNGDHKIEFRVYASESGGKPIYRETMSAVRVDRGRFRSEIGKQSPLELDFAKDYYISISVGNGPERACRQKVYRSTDPRRAEALGGDLAYIVADGPPDIVEQSSCDMSIHPGGNWGAQIGIWRGVIANSNGDDTGDWSSLEPYCEDGYRYQCVEYPRKFYRLAMGMDTSNWFANGNQFYTKGPGWGLNRYANNGTSLPQTDDILCMDGSTYGHVAVVTGVTSSTVSIIQQNCSTTTAYRNLSIAGGIVQGWGSLYIQGWLRKPGYSPVPGMPILTSPTNDTFFHPGTSTVTVTAQYSSDGPTPDSYRFRLFDAGGNQIATSGWVTGTTSATYTFSVQTGCSYQWTAKTRLGSVESAEAARSTFTVNIGPYSTTLISPAPGEWWPSQTVTFAWNEGMDPCPGPSPVRYRLTLKYLATGYTRTFYPITSNSVQLTPTTSGPHTWKIECSDGLDFSAATEERRLVIDANVPTPEAVGVLRSHSDGPTSVACGPVVVTAGLDRFADGFYVGATDKSAGIAVKYDSNGGPAVTAGDQLDVIKGTLTTTSGERILQNALVSGITHGREIPGPVYLGSATLGGESRYEATPSVLGGTGVYNLGMLVTVCGNVTYKDPAGAFFYVDDGSGLQDGSDRIGVRVSVTGLASGNTVRCVRPRSQSDIVPRP